MRLQGVLAFGSIVAGLAIAVISLPGKSSAQLDPTPAPVPSGAVDPDALLGAVRTAGALRVVPGRLDLDPAAVGEYQRGTVAIVNTMKQPIRVQAAKPSCGCTKVVGFTPAVVDPGGWLDVDIRMTALSKLGRQEKFVTFLIEGQRPLKLTVGMDVLAAGSTAPGS